MVTNNGSITTQGASAYGIEAQSVGGGGGAGGSQTSLFGLGDASGGDGSDNGNDATVTADGAINTYGANAYGVLAQSIGGGGGDGGGSTGLSAIGGNGGAGGIGGNANILTYSGATLMTSGDLAFGMLAQSIGGGGGAAGDVTVVGAGLTIGYGTVGAGGGAAATAHIELGSHVITTGDQADGVVAQSIGGGGGNGGNATAVNTVVGFSVAVGGAGGTGGASGTAEVDAFSGSKVMLYGSNSTGIVAQAVGGGGGNGGDGFSASAGVGLTGAFSLGGTGGDGGAGGTAIVNLTGARPTVFLCLASTQKQPIPIRVMIITTPCRWIPTASSPRAWAVAAARAVPASLRQWPWTCLCLIPVDRWL
jgi:hypothetical protein